MDRVPDAGRSPEESAVQRCREYHEESEEPSDSSEARARLSTFAAQFYARAGIRTEGTAPFRLLEDSDTVTLEIAHDAQLPHLGIVRMVLKAEEIARLAKTAVALYMIGTHYTPAMRPEHLRYGMPLFGRSPDAIDAPPRIPVGAGNRHLPFSALPPPSSLDLADLENRLTEYIRHNVGYERRAGRSIQEADKELIINRLQMQFRFLSSTAGKVSSFGDWIVRVQHDLLRDMLGPGIDRIVFLPMADLKDIVRPQLEEIAKVSPSQFWMSCSSCRHRQRFSWTQASTFPFKCTACGVSRSLSRAEAWESLTPDVAAFEIALVRLGIDGWIVGSRAGYHPRVEALHRQVWGIEMPPKFLLASVPRYRGLGDPPEGEARTRLLRALLEVEPPRLAELLSGPWAANPEIVSEFLA